jgi:hypothetical protein
MPQLQQTVYPRVEGDLSTLPRSMSQRGDGAQQAFQPCRVEAMMIKRTSEPSAYQRRAGFPLLLLFEKAAGFITAARASVVLKVLI